MLDSESNASVNNGPQFQRQKGDVSFSDLGPLKDNERRDLNCAVKEYLIIAGYRLTAMTFFEEVSIFFPSSITLGMFILEAFHAFFCLLDICSGNVTRLFQRLY